MMKIETELIQKIEKSLKTTIHMMEGEHKTIIKCGQKGRLISNLFHRADLDIHCNYKGVFTINHDEHKPAEIMDALYEISNHPEWVIDFIEKYIDNHFMMSTTFKPCIEQAN